MGEYADYEIERIIDRHMMVGGATRKRRARPNYHKSKWIDANGHIWNIRDMSSTHIMNCINKCSRDGDPYRKIPELDAELQRRTQEFNSQCPEPGL